MTHPYHEDYVVLRARSTIRTDSRSIERDLGFRILHEDTSASTWSASTWVNICLEKHAWISAGLVWMPGASDSGAKGAYDDSGPNGLESRPTINLFELWENGSHLLKLVAGRNDSFPRSLVVPCAWIQSPKFLPVSERCCA